VVVARSRARLRRHAIVGAISHRAIAGTPGSTGWFASALRHYVIVPAGSPLTYGNILYVVAIVMLSPRAAEGIRRLISPSPRSTSRSAVGARLTLDPASPLRS